MFGLEFLYEILGASPVFSAILLTIITLALKDAVFRGKKDKEQRDKEIERLEKKFTGNLPKGVQQIAKRKKLKLKFKGYMSYVPLPIVFFLFLSMIMIMGYVIENKYKSSLPFTIRAIDNKKKGLKQKTIRCSTRDLCKDGSANELENIHCCDAEQEEKMINKWEDICKTKAEVEYLDKTMISDLHRIDLLSSVYRTCMLEQGWTTQECTDNEQGCVQLVYLEGPCTRRDRESVEYGERHPSVFRCLKERSEQYR